MIDLGMWAKEEYRVAGEQLDPAELPRPANEDED